VTIATLMLGRLGTLADVHQEVKHDMCQHNALRTWLRDEEAEHDEAHSELGRIWVRALAALALLARCRRRRPGH
jgi:hypothetical protein